MHVVIYTRAFPPMIGGIETITMELAKRLARSGDSERADQVQVTVVTPSALKAPDEENLPFGILRKPRFAQLLRLIVKADIFHIAGSDMLPLFLAWILRARVVVEHHGFQTACPNGQMIYEPTQAPCPGHFMAGSYLQCLKCNAARGMVHTLKRLLLTFPRRWLCQLADANVMPTAWLGDIVQLPRLVTIHHGLPASDNASSSPVGKPPSIVFMGRLVSTKGVHILLQAMRQLRDCEFELNIIGDGPERNRLEADVRDLQLEERVVFQGYLPADEAEQALALARAVVMPSVGGEVFGLVALENMLRNKVLIVSQIGALTEVVGDAGLTFPAGDADALARCLRRMLESDEFVTQAGALAGLRARSLFTAQRMVGDHLALYRKLLGAPPSSDLARDSQTVPSLTR